MGGEQPLFSSIEKVSKMAELNKPGIQTGMGNTVSEAPKTLAAVQESNAPKKAPGYYSIHAGRCCGEPWPMNDPFVPTTQDQLDFCEDLVKRGYASLVGDKPKLK